MVAEVPESAGSESRLLYMPLYLGIHCTNFMIVSTLTYIKAMVQLKFFSHECSTECDSRPIAYQCLPHTSQYKPFKIYSLK